MEGTPLIASTNIRTGLRPLPPISFRKTAVARARGTEIRMAMATCSSVPTMECSAPPAFAPEVGATNCWVCTKNVNVNALMPFAMMKTTIITSGTIRRNAPMVITTDHSLSFAATRSSTSRTTSQ